MRSAAERLRILVLGYMVRGPLGGLAWHHLQYVMSLRDLGHEVYFFEDSEDYPACYDPSRLTLDTDPTYGLEFTRHAFGRIGHEHGWAYYDAHRQRWSGPCADRALDICRTADLVLNVSGVNPLRPWLREIPVRVLIDTDPVFTQIDFLEDPVKRALADQHNVFFTFGESFGSPTCRMPDDGRPWRPTRQPVALAAWPVTPGPVDGSFTTVMMWDSYDRREYGGMTFGMKSESFGPYLDLPRRTSAHLELALGSPSAPGDRLAALGWRIHDPLEVTRDPWTYQSFIRSSKAEFTLAKHGYVVSASGWFSERSAAYLASGRPVVTEDTGFSRHLPVGEGLLAFSDPEGALTAIQEVESDYARHCRAAREVVEAHFDGRRVLTALIEAAFAATA